MKEITKEYIKKQKTGRRAILGVRGDESVMRKEQYKTCFTKTLKFTPLHDLTDELLNKIYSKYNIEIPEVYKYVERTGCMGCPYGSHYGDTEKELSLISESQKNVLYVSILKKATKC